MKAAGFSGVASAMRSVLLALVPFVAACVPSRPTVIWSGGPQAESTDVVALRLQASDDFGCAESLVYQRESFDEKRVATGCGQGAIHESWRGRNGLTRWVRTARFKVARVAP